MVLHFSQRLFQGLLIVAPRPALSALKREPGRYLEGAEDTPVPNGDTLLDKI